VQFDNILRKAVAEKIDLRQLYLIQSQHNEKQLLNQQNRNVDAAQYFCRARAQEHIGDRTCAAAAHDDLANVIFMNEMRGHIGRIADTNMLRILQARRIEQFACASKRFLAFFAVILLRSAVQAANRTGEPVLNIE
jgi:hypothetical protein